MIFKSRLLILLFIVISLSACQQKTILKTPEGIPRKVVVKKDNTSLYNSTKLDNSVATIDQWDILFVFGEAEKHYVISKDMQEYPENPFYVNKSDVFEWNSYFCLTFKNSPHQSGRSPIVIYQTKVGAKNGDHSDSNMIEKEKHETYFHPNNAMPMIKEYEDKIYFVASLYDDLDEKGNYVFLGNFDFGFLKYDDKALELRRYVSKQQLARQLRVVLGMTGKAKSNPNPQEIDALYGPLVGFLADFDNLEKGMEDIINVFRGEDVPSAAQEGLFEPESFIENIENLDPQLAVMTEKMLDHIKNPGNWNENDYTYIPAEWMEQ